MTDDIDRSVRLAADILVDSYGVEGAVQELQDRIASSHGDEQDRALEALGYIRREVAR